MSSGGAESRQVRFTRQFPWVRLLRGIGLALDARKLALAVLGLIVLMAGWSGIALLFGADTNSPERFLTVGTPVPLPMNRDAVWNMAERVTDPVRLISYPLAGVFEIGGGTPRFLAAFAGLIWGLVVWGLFGGAIARVAAVQAATGARIGLLAALRYAASRLVPLAAAPLVALGGIAGLAAFCALVGLLYQASHWGGEVVAGVIAGLPLLLGGVMAWLLIGLAAGWPLMVSTIAVEGEDTFDALSRSYSYVFQRPISYTFYVLLAWAVGVAGFVFVSLLARLVIHLTAWGLAFGAPDGRIHQLFEVATTSGPLADSLHGRWVQLVWLLAYSWVFSYFWTAASRIYLLLRHEVDGTPWEEIAL